MDHVHDGAGWAAGSFWLFIAAAVIAGTWEKIRRNAEKHETLRRIMEKTGTLDETRLRELFSPSGSGSTPMKPGTGYRALRIGGTIIMGLAAAVAFFFLVLCYFGPNPWDAGTVGGLIVSGGVAIFGLGLFISSRFAEPPPDLGNGPKR